MKKGNSRRRPTTSKRTVDPRSKESDLPQPQSGRHALDPAAALESSVREKLSRHLHDLLNSLWPAAARIEMTIADKSCPQKFRETLELLRSSIEEAMAISAQASSLIDLPGSDRDRT